MPETPVNELLNDLNGVLTLMQPLSPTIMSEAYGFLPELRAALSLSQTRDRNALRMDAENLLCGLTELHHVMAAGVRNSDTDAAESDVVRLIASMRVRCAQLIKDRTSLIRIHTETAAEHAGDRGMSDVTDAFRIVASRPSMTADSSALLVQSVNRSGALGRIRGHVLTFCVFDKRGFDNSAELGSLVLPENHVITLCEGERVLLRHDGISFNGGEVSDKEKSVAHVIEAQEDGVTIIGPATLSLVTSRLPELRDTVDMVSEMREDVSSCGRLRQYIGRESEPFLILLISFLMMLLPPLGFLGVSEGNTHPLHVLGFVPAAGFMTYALTQRNRVMRTAKNVKSRLMNIWTFTGRRDISEEKLRVSLYCEAINCLEHKIREAREITFRPVSKVTTDGDGTLYIRPLPQLPAPDAVVDVNARKATA